MVLNDEQYKSVWDRVYKELKFSPCSLGRSSISLFPPFEISSNHVIYDIENTNDDDNDGLEALIANAFIKCTKPNERIYALDWHHSAFLYDPRKSDEQKSIFVEDKRYSRGGYYAYFPGFYPDGDYYFFISEDFRFGYLTHPWRQEAWVFGDMLIEEFEKFYKSIGWKKIY